MLSSSTAALAAVALCVIAAVLEGLCAGTHVRAFFRTVRVPRYSAPLWVWSIIGALYYAVFGFVVFRLLRSAPTAVLTRATLTLIVAMMIANGLSNLVIFRARNLSLSHMIGCIFAGLDGLLAVLVRQLDPVAAAALLPYLAYRVYAVWWGRELARLNP